MSNLETLKNTTDSFSESEGLSKDALSKQLSAIINAGILTYIARFF